MSSQKGGGQPGITWRSLCASLLAMLLLGICIQYGEVIQNHAGALAEQSVTLPGVAVLVLLLGLSATSVWLTGRRMLTRPELLCVMYAMVIATPIMTQGMWHRFFGLLAATPREGNFAHLDVVSDKLWPHGPNRLAGALDTEPAESARGSVSWRKMNVTPGHQVLLPVVHNSQPGDTSAVVIRVPLERDGAPWLDLGEPHLVSVLVRPEGLGAESTYFIRAYADDESTFTDLYSGRKPAEVTFLQPEGFLRVGKYAARLPPTARREIRLEIGLNGTGELAVHDPKLFDVSAIERAYQGRRLIDAEGYAKLEPHARGGLLVRPDSLWSLEGVRFLFSGYIPVADWRQPMLAWCTPILLLIVGLYAVAVIMRRQWADSERYAFPLARIPVSLIGEPGESEGPLWAAIWRSRLMWAGLAVALVWSQLRMWAFYNPKVPDTAINVLLKPYLDSPGWGEMWDISFQVSTVLVSICMFFELNVLLSLVVGFFCYRALLWIGEFSGLQVYTGYPFRYEQAVGAYLAYAAVILFFVRRYLFQVCRSALAGRNGGEEGSAYRGALITLVVVHLGIAAWARWLGVPVGGILLYFGFLMVIGFVAMKIRGECGVPLGYFTPYNAMLFVALLGGMPVFGASGVMVCVIASGFLTATVFFFIPGAQLELIEYGRRYQLAPRHAAWAVAIGALGGLFIGGWVFLSNAYALGGDTIRNQWTFNQGWLFGSFKAQLAQTTGEMLRLQGGVDASAGLEPATWAYAYGAVVTVSLAVLRQLFAGFWFHPVGFLVGSAHMMEWAWGSVLAAWVIRAVALKTGGAATVKTRLYPFFTGVFLGSVVFLVINLVHAGLLQGSGVEQVYGVLP